MERNIVYGGIILVSLLISVASYFVLRHYFYKPRDDKKKNERNIMYSALIGLAMGGIVGLLSFIIVYHKHESDKHITRYQQLYMKHLTK